MEHAVADRRRRDPSTGRQPRPWWFDDWTEGLYPEIRAAARSYVEVSKMKLHSHAAAVHSSMAFAFNLFLPFRVWGAAPLGRVLSGALGRVVTVEAVEFEYCDTDDILGEWVGATRSVDDKATTADVAVVVVDENRKRGVVLIEVKCGEEGFTACNGRDSAGNRRKDVCASAARFLKEPRSCYLTHTYRATKDRRYWDIFEKEFGSVEKAFPTVETGQPCPFAGDNQQPMRNHALALGLVQAGKFDFSHFGLVHHDRNPDIPPKWDAYVARTSAGSALFSLSASSLLDVPSAAGPLFADWKHYVRERYAL